MERIELWNKDLLKELSDYQPPNHKANKAFRIHLKCISVGKIFLADKIRLKYGNLFPVNDDCVMAFAMALHFNFNK